jgi:Mg-chelatase subunit ChlD
MKTIHDKKGQMRIVEAMIACILLIFSVSAATRITRLGVLSETNDLQKVGENVLDVLNNPDVVRKIMESEGSAEAQLNSLISSFLPPGTGYIVSFVSAIDGTVICNASNTDMASSEFTSFSDTRTVTISLPAAKSEYRSIDVMMVMDRSGSMGDRDESGNVKITLAKAAAKTFVDQLNMTRDEVGLASFSTEATLDCHLTNNSAQIKSKIDSMIANGWTNMGGGIYRSNVEFQENGRTDPLWAMILLSDGLANYYYNEYMQPIHDEVMARQYALDQAEIARNLGARIYTIGLGKPGDIDEDLLKQIANDPTRYFHAPTADQLETIYLTIARDLLFQVKYDIIVIQLTLLGGQ